MGWHAGRNPQPGEEPGPGEGLAGGLAQAGDTLRLATQEADRLGEHLYDPQLRALQARLR